MGQNAAEDWSPDAKNWSSTVYDVFFMSQLEHFNQSNLMFVTKEDTRDLTQVLWAATTRVGCGYIRAETPFAFEEDEDLNNDPKHFYICLYGPAGNVAGQYIYEQAGM